MLKKLFLLLLKYIPVMQMMGMLVSNTLYYYRINTLYYFIADYSIGNSFITTILLYVCSYVFKFCNWHRFMITSNFISINLVLYDKIIGIPLNNKEMLLLYYIIATIFSLIAIYSKFHCHESTNKETSSK